MAITTTTQIAGPVNYVFQMNLLRNAKAHCPYFAGTVPAEIREHAGTFTALWRRVENLTPTTTSLSELTGAVAFPTRTGSQFSINDASATVQKYGDFVFLNEEVDLVNPNPLAAKYSEVLGIQAGRSLNRLQRNIAEDSLTAQFTGSSTTATNVSFTPTASGQLSLSSIAAVVNLLDRNDGSKFKPMTTGSQNIGTTPIRAAYLAMCHVDTTAHLRTLTGWNEVMTYAGQTETWPGEVGHVGGVRFIESTESSIDTGTGVAATGSATAHGRQTATRYDVYNTVVYGQDALGSLGLGEEHVKEMYQAGDKLPGIMMISHNRGSAGTGDPLNELSSMGWKSWHGGLVLNSGWGRCLRHPNANLTSLE